MRFRTQADLMLLLPGLHAVAGPDSGPQGVVVELNRAMEAWNIRAHIHLPYVLIDTEDPSKDIAGAVPLRWRHEACGLDHNDCLHLVPVAADGDGSIGYCPTCPACAARLKKSN